MKGKASDFTFVPATREGVSIIVAIAGASGSGKTRSALEIARGLADGDDTKIAVIDTESGRAKHYAVRPGEAQGPGRFAFMHGDLTAPFTPDRYAAAIEAAEAAGAKVIVVDSTSHEWEGDGGLHDMQGDALDDAVEKARKSHNSQWGPFDEGRVRERANIGAWKEPKRLHKRFVSRLLQSRAHLILCLRADEKLIIEQITDERGRKKTIIKQPKEMPPAERWTPICEKRFMYEMTASIILSPDTPGIPVATPKLQEQHRVAFPKGALISESAGRMLAAWARGENINDSNPAPSAAHRPQSRKEPEPERAPDPEPETVETTKDEGSIKDDGASSASSGSAGGRRQAAPPAAPTAEQYIDGWDVLLDDENKTAAELHAIWSGGKALRTRVTWPDDDSFDLLKERVQKRINQLKARG
jgi:hypothetical protein